jgi:hypothetical protein
MWDMGPRRRYVKLAMGNWNRHARRFRMKFDGSRVARAKVNAPMAPEELAERLRPFPLTPTEIGWAAGIVDGEGCIGLYNSGGYAGPRLNLAVASIDPRLTAELHRLFGGTLTRRHHAEPHLRSAETWTTTGITAARVLNTVAPALIIKREQADVALRWAETITNRGGRLPWELVTKRTDLAAMLSKLHATAYIERIAR